MLLRSKLANDYGKNFIKYRPLLVIHLLQNHLLIPFIMQYAYCLQGSFLLPVKHMFSSTEIMCNEDSNLTEGGLFL